MTHSSVSPHLTYKAPHLQSTATHCNTLQHTAIQSTATAVSPYLTYKALQHTAIHCNTKHCNSCVSIPHLQALSHIPTNVRYSKKTHITHKSIWINKSSVNPKSTSNQSSKPCTVLLYPSRNTCDTQKKHGGKKVVWVHIPTHPHTATIRTWNIKPKT